tara:strand:- start:118916 stop:120475 length:1560 start_codon:yes stop_codon:yes gene_type:complete
VLTLGELVRRHALIKPECDAYVDPFRRVNWRQFHKRTDQLALVISAQGVQSGDRVGVVSGDCIEVAETFVACSKMGAIRVGISGRLAAREIAHLISDSGLSLLFVQQKYLNRVQEALLQLKVAPTMIVFEDGRTDSDYEVQIAQQTNTDAFQPTPQENLMLCYTTGSTGLPKGAVYKHGLFVQSMFAIALAEGACHDDVWLHAMPAAGVPVMHMLRNLSHGSKCAIVGDWTPEGALRMIEQERTTITVLVPTMLTSLIDSGLVGEYDTSSMRQLGYGAAPIPPAAMREAVRTFGCSMLQMYGSTELMGMSMMLYPSDHERGLTSESEHILASAGRPLPYVLLKVVDEEGNEVPRGETGELLISCEYVIQEYWNNLEQYNKTVVDGWLHTGDMARMDHEGYVYLGDRAKFRIKTGGYNVFPTEVENVVAEHPSVLEVCVVGLPDTTWGERIHAVVSLKKGSQVSADDLRQFCRGKIADFKVPKTVDVWPEIPKGVTGKILKRQVIEHYLGLEKQTGVMRQ